MNTSEHDDPFARDLARMAGGLTPVVDGASMAGTAIRREKQRRVGLTAAACLAMLVAVSGAVVAGGTVKAESEEPLPGASTPASGDSAVNPLTGQSEDELTEYERDRLEQLRGYCGDVGYPVEDLWVMGSSEVPEWPGMFDHAVTRPDVPIAEPPHVSVRSIGCDPAPLAAVLADPARERVILLHADMEGESVGGSEPLHGTTPLRGTTAKAGATGDGSNYARWAEAGVTWVATATGLTSDELLAVLEDLEIVSATEVGVAAGELPLNLSQVEVPRHDPDELRFTWELMQTMDDSGGLAPYLSATWPAGPVEAHFEHLDRAQAVSFDGGVALYVPSDGPGAAVLQWVDDGVSYMLSDSDADLEAMKELARSIEPISIDDPRLSSHRSSVPHSSPRPGSPEIGEIEIEHTIPEGWTQATTEGLSYAYPPGWDHARTTRSDSDVRTEIESEEVAFPQPELAHLDVRWRADVRSGNPGRNYWPGFADESSGGAGEIEVPGADYAFVEVAERSYSGDGSLKLLTADVLLHQEDNGNHARIQLDLPTGDEGAELLRDFLGTLRYDH